MRHLANATASAREASWIQQTPNGDMSVVYVEADDIEAAMAGLGSSQGPFDVWFREQTREMHGINIEDGFPPPSSCSITARIASRSEARPL